MNNTTKSFLQELHSGIKNNDNPDNWFCNSKAELTAQYKIFSHIRNTLSSYELYLLWYLRMAEFGATHRFMRAAKKAYKAHQAFLELDENNKNE